MQVATISQQSKDIHVMCATNFEVDAQIIKKKKLKGMKSTAGKLTENYVISNFSHILGFKKWTVINGHHKSHTLQFVRQVLFSITGCSY